VQDALAVGIMHITPKQKGRTPLKFFAQPSDQSRIDSRHDCSVETNQTATVTGLKSGVLLTGRIAEVSGSVMRVFTGQPLTSGETVKVECEDTLWLGEVSFCKQVARGYAAGIKLEQALYGMAELARIAESFLAEGAA
jgi:hypothetical protein